MSVNQLTDDDLEIEQETESLAERLNLHPAYEPVIMDPVEGYGDLVDAWVTMQYPLNVSDRFGADHGIIECGNWRHAKQHPDGSGVYRSGPKGGQVVAYRTANGVIIWNNYRNDPWPYKAEAKDAVDHEFEVPYKFIGEVLTRQTDLDLHDEGANMALGRLGREAEGTWVDGEQWMLGVVHADVLEGEEEGILLEHTNGSQVYVGLDSTAHEYPMFAFAPFDGAEGIKVPSARDALDLLRPDEALATERRQGEWFFVPADETHDDANGTIQKPGIGEKEWAFEHRGYDLGPFDSMHTAIGEVTKAFNERDREMWMPEYRDSITGRRTLERRRNKLIWLIGEVEATKAYFCGSPLDGHIPRDWKTRCGDREFVRRVVEYLTQERDVDLHEDDRYMKEELTGLEYEDLEDIGVWWQDTPQSIFDKIQRGEIDLTHAEARELSGGIFVRGSVRHRHNEHTMMTLDGWHQPVTHEQEVLVLEPEHMNVHVDV